MRARQVRSLGLYTSALIELPAAVCCVLYTVALTHSWCGTTAASGDNDTLIPFPTYTLHASGIPASPRCVSSHVP